MWIAILWCLMSMVAQVVNYRSVVVANNRAGREWDFNDLFLNPVYVLAMVFLAVGFVALILAW